MRAFWLLALLLLSGCAYWHASPPRGPDAVDEDVRLGLRITLVGYTGTMLLLFGGPQHDVFLGCLTCDKDDAKSIFNDRGRFGSLSDPRSIWNTAGAYGSQTSPLSPWNPHASTPPLLRDEFERFYGYFTVDAHYPERTRLPPVVRFLTLQTLQ